MISSPDAPSPGRDSSSVVLEAREFTRHLADLLAKEHAAMVDFVLALAEFDGRRLWADLGYASLFDFLHRELGMSAGAAFYRKTAAALAQRFPAIIDGLADGRLCITSIPEIAKVITNENAQEVIPRFFHRSKREAREVAAAIAPQIAPAHRELITTIRSPAARRVTADEEDLPRTPASAPARSDRHPERDAVDRCCTDHEDPTPDALAGQHRAELRRPPVADHVEPLTASLRRVHMTVSDRWVQKLEALRAALSHSHPAGRAEEITEYALDIALEHLASKKGLRAKQRSPEAARSAGRSRRRKENRQASHAATHRAGKVSAASTTPAATDAAPDPVAAKRRVGRRPNVPAEVRRAVIARDAGRCQWKLHDGTVCGSNVRVQLDHVHPVALGGSSTVENLRLLCARHNQLAARSFFGKGWMSQFSRATTGAPAAASAPERRATDSS